MRISDWSSDVCSSDLAVTKSGTNEFHGEAFIDYTDQSLRDARPNELTTSKVKTKDFQFGGALGGPIIKDMLHFFVTYEGKRQENPVDVRPGLNLPVDYLDRKSTRLNSSH